MFPKPPQPPMPKADAAPPPSMVVALMGGVGNQLFQYAFGMKTALLFIATGERYRQYAEGMIRSAKEFFFEHDTIVFADGPVEGASWVFKKEPLGYPNETLRRYNTFMTQEALLRSYDYLFYSDADMKLIAPVKPGDICSGGITATLHPGYFGNSGTPERNPKSTAYIDRDATNHYFCGGFNGGTSKAYMDMAATIAKNVDTDAANGIIAVWHDESHLNRYLYENPPARILTPSFCTPEGYHDHWGWTMKQFPPVLLALHKGAR